MTSHSPPFNCLLFTFVQLPHYVCSKILNCIGCSHWRTAAGSNCTTRQLHYTPGPKPHYTTGPKTQTSARAEGSSHCAHGNSQSAPSVISTRLLIGRRSPSPPPLAPEIKTQRERCKDNVRAPKKMPLPLLLLLPWHQMFARAEGSSHCSLDGGSVGEKNSTATHWT